MFLKDFSFDLPEELIATKPAYPRDSSRLLFLESKNSYKESLFSSIYDYLLPGDLLIVNNTKVNSSKIKGYKKNTNIDAEFTFIRNEKDGIWLCFALPGKKVNEGNFFIFKDIEGKIIKKNRENIYIDFGKKNKEFNELLLNFGQITLPPYISKLRSFEEKDNEDYQTIYARESGSIAAPTAGLHFTDKLLAKIKSKDINIESITLNIGPGTSVSYTHLRAHET